MGKNSSEANHRSYEKNKVKTARNHVCCRLLKGEYVKPDTIKKYDIRRQHFTSEQLAMIHPSVILINKEIIKMKDLSIPWEFFTDLGQVTIRNYQSSIRSLMKLLKVSDDSLFFLALTDFDRVEEALSSKSIGTITKAMTVVVSICKKSAIHRNLLKDVHHLYYDRMMMSSYHKYETMVAEKQRSFFYDCYVPLWSDIMTVYHEIAKTCPMSLTHLLLSTMVLIPPIRDNWGNVMFISDEADVIEGQNYYDISTQKLGLFDQKWSKKKGFAEVSISNELAEILATSLYLVPRTYIFQQADGTPYKLLSPLIISAFNFGINDLRHSYTTYVIENDEIGWTEKTQLIKASLHTPMAAINEYYYPTENQVIEIDDE